MFRRGHQECVTSVLVPKDSERGAVVGRGCRKDQSGDQPENCNFVQAPGLTRPGLTQGLLSLELQQDTLLS